MEFGGPLYMGDCSLKLGGPLGSRWLSIWGATPGPTGVGKRGILPCPIGGGIPGPDGDGPSLDGGIAFREFIGGIYIGDGPLGCPWWWLCGWLGGGCEREEGPGGGRWSP